ncbi:MAG: hypothetical protein JJD97_05655, partial [Gemmatimonadaceae bacterium]|nr:hypothetical protein [Gemmatimonadaceae bacterium]
MSTHLRRVVVLASAALLGLAGCSHPVSQRLADVCFGYSVVQHVVLVVDTLTTRAGPSAQKLKGKTYPVTINLHSLLNHSRCEENSGEGAVLGYLPDVLTAAVATRRQVMRWYVDGRTLRVDLNPGVIDNNLSFALPMDGRTGRWSLAQLSGEVGFGRLLRDSTA